MINGDELTIRGVASMLQTCPETIELVSFASTPRAPIDIALYDHAAAGDAGRATLAQLVADPRIGKVAVFTWNFQPWMAGDLIERGVCAYLSKGLTGAELVKALLALDTSERLVRPRGGFARAETGTPAKHGEVLTAREAEVLSLICRGLSNTDIADTMNVSANTVKSYIRSCYRRIDVDSRSRAVLWGLSRGFGDSTAEHGAGQTRPTRRPRPAPGTGRLN